MRKLNKNEEAYAFSRNNEIDADAVSGCIGHLRCDFGGTGKAFHHTWWPHQEELCTPEFKQSLGRVIEELRKSVLAGRRECADFCLKHLDRNFGENQGYGGRVDEGGYAFIFRLNACLGEYDAYVYCYAAEKLNGLL